MNHNFKLIAMAVVVSMTLVNTASADTIPGTFVGADASNTTAVGGGAFSSDVNAAGMWFDQSGNVGSANDLLALNGGNSASPTGSGGYNAGSGDTDIVTTISGLTSGASYDVNLIWTGQWGNTDFPYSPSFTAGDISNQIADRSTGDFPFGSWLDEESNTFTAGVNTAFRVWSTAIGTINADTDGEIEVFVNLLPAGAGVFYGNNQAYNGVSFTSAAVPEPGSTALLLGLSGLVMARRRR